MHGVDRRLQLVGAGAVQREAAADEPVALVDQRGVPPGPVLLVERHQAAVGDARPGAGLDQQHQREQPVDLGLGA